MIVPLLSHHEITSLVHRTITYAMGTSDVTFWADAGIGKDSVIVGSVKMAERAVLLRHLHNLTRANDASEPTEIHFSKIHIQAITYRPRQHFLRLSHCWSLNTFILSSILKPVLAQQSSVRIIFGKLGYPLSYDLAKSTTSSTIEIASLPSNSHPLRSGHPKSCILF